MPTGIWSSRWRSGGAHWNLELAVEVRQCPLGSGARVGGSGYVHWDVECEEEEEENTETEEEESNSDKI